MIVMVWTVVGWLFFATCQGFALVVCAVLLGQRRVDRARRRPGVAVLDETDPAVRV